MNISRMKNMIVLKDLPSNLVDEAIVILKNSDKVKNKEIAEKSCTSSKNFEESADGGYEAAIKEAEYLVTDYIKKLEAPKEEKKNIKDLQIQYRKMQICSVFLGIVAILGIVISILK